MWISDEMIENAAAAIFAHCHKSSPDKWPAVLSWADGSVANAIPGSDGWKAAQIRGEAPFEEAREVRDRCRTLARIALEGALTRIEP